MCSEVNDVDERQNSPHSESDERRGIDHPNADSTANTSAAGTESFEYTVDADELIVDAVTTAVSIVEGCTPTDLAPLYGVLDPDALESLTRTRKSEIAALTRVNFPYSGYAVEVRGRERVVVSEQDVRSTPRT